MDSLICQTSTASPGRAGGSPSGLVRNSRSRCRAELCSATSLASSTRGACGLRGEREGADTALPVITVEANLRVADATVEAGGEIYVPISPAAEVIRRAIREPLQSRHPVGYDHEFLDAYRPNQIFYLPEETRRRLFELGRSANDELPAETYVPR